jgi:uncharacterized protein YacL
MKFLYYLILVYSNVVHFPAMYSLIFFGKYTIFIHVISVVLLFILYQTAVQSYHEDRQQIDILLPTDSESSMGMTKEKNETGNCVKYRRINRLY